MSKQRAYLLLLAVVLVWCFLIVLPPMMTCVQVSANPLYDFFSMVCHQYDSHSLHLFGFKLGVCARCSGIYGGFFLGMLLIPLIPEQRPKNAILWWIVAAVPMLADVMMNTIQLHTSTLVTRCCTGAFFGVAAAILLVPIIVDAISEFTLPKTIKQGESHGFKA